MLQWTKEAAGIYRAENGAATFDIEKQPDRSWLLRAKPKAGGGFAQASRATLRDAQSAAEKQARERRYH